jgi:hypothetical protein
MGLLKNEIEGGDRCKHGEIVGESTPNECRR